MLKSFKIDFIGIGAPKSGSTWLFNCLGLHPRICLSVPKEIKYFNHIDYTKYIRNFQDDNLVNKNHYKPLSWYERCFKHCHQGSIKGEFTPSYLFDDKAPFLIRKNFPDIKLIACLRNPIDRAYSSYWGRTNYTKKGKLSFEEAIKEDLMYIEGGLYHKHLTRYLDYFRRDKILIVLFDDIVLSPEKEIKKVFGFLDVDSTIKLNLGAVSINKAKKSWFPFISLIMKDFPNLLIDKNLGYLLHIARMVGMREFFLSLTTSTFIYPEMNPNTRQYLRSVFDDDIRQLEKLLNRDLSQWL